MKKRKANLADFLKTAREAKGMSQAELSRALGYATSQFVCNWEKGRSSPPLEAVAKMLDILNIQQEEIVEQLVLETRNFIEEKLSKVRSQRRTSGRKL